MEQNVIEQNRGNANEEGVRKKLYKYRNVVDSTQIYNTYICYIGFVVYNTVYRHTGKQLID